MVTRTHLNVLFGLTLLSVEQRVRHSLLVGEDLEGCLRLESQKCQQSAYMWQPWNCISCVAVHRVGLPLGRTASPRFRGAQWTF